MEGEDTKAGEERQKGDDRSLSSSALLQLLIFSFRGLPKVFSGCLSCFSLKPPRLYVFSVGKKAIYFRLTAIIASGTGTKYRSFYAASACKNTRTIFMKAVFATLMGSKQFLARVGEKCCCCSFNAHRSLSAKARGMEK